jgi:uncharacterized membrane protein YcgQ (UPF0703/DUF1980 family)
MKTVVGILVMCVVFGCANAEPPGAAADPPGSPPENFSTANGSAASGSGEAPPEEIVEIREKMFIAHTNEIYLNAEDYLGRTIKLEGLFKQEEYQNLNHRFVLRYGPGCCGNDGNAGFEVVWEDSRATLRVYPRPDDWVEAVGILKTYEEDGFPYLYIALSSLRVLDKRGAEYVTQ